MKRKCWNRTLALIMICAVVFLATNVTIVSAASDQPTAKYTDWAFNDDFTKVTVNGKTYDNYVVIVRNNQELVMMNMWGDYLTSPYAQIAQTPDEFATGLDNSLKSIFSGNESKYPLNEVLSINYVLWQETKFKDAYLWYFDTFYDSQFTNTISRSDLWSILEDKSCNGLALGIMREKLTKKQSATKYDLSKMKVTTQDWEIVKTGVEFVEKNGGQAFAPTELTYPTQADIQICLQVANSTLTLLM